MKYYRLEDDINYPNRWYLGDILRYDNWQFISDDLNFSHYDDLQLQVYKDGARTDFAVTEGYGIPVVSPQVKDALSDFSGIRFIPVTILKDEAHLKYFILMVGNVLDCVDESLSEFQKFESNDPVRPDKEGEYRAFFKLIVRPDVIKGEHIFRIKKFDVALVVSDLVKEKLKGFTGLNFTLVSPH